MRYNVVFREGKDVIFDTVEMTFEQAEKFKGLPEFMSIELITEEMLDEVQ